MILEKDASLIVFDDELSPSQGKNIEDATGQRVMDRAELILDIFATRARSSKAKCGWSWRSSSTCCRG